jgi:hypothetical protein
MMPCSKFLFLATIFPKNGREEVEKIGREEVENFFSGH